MAAPMLQTSPLGQGSPTGAFTVEVRDEPAGWTIVYLAGELDLASSGYLETVLGGIDARGSSGLTIDLAELEFMDVTGLHVLSRARRCAVDAGRRFTIRNSRGQVERLLQLAGDAVAPTPGIRTDARQRLSVVPR